MKKRRTIATICQFGGSHGWGHLTRSSALMSEARKQGWKTSLWTPSDCDGLTKSQRQPFDDIRRLNRYGFDEMKERSFATDVVFVDDMDSSDSFFDDARFYVDGVGAKLVAMDDLGIRSMKAVDLTVNTELGLSNSDYRSTETALGEKYCLLRSGFRNAEKRSWPLNTDAVPVLMMIGGTDPGSLGISALEALEKLSSSHLFAPIFISGSGKNRKELVDLLDGFPEYRLEVGVDDRTLADWIETARFGIIACGSSMYEFGALETPFVGLVAAENQERSARAISNRWGLPIARFEDGKLPLDAIAESIETLLCQLERKERFDFGEVDAFGVERVMRRIDSLFS